MEATTIRRAVLAGAAALPAAALPALPFFAVAATDPLSKIDRGRIREPAPPMGDARPRNGPPARRSAGDVERILKERSGRKMSLDYLICGEGTFRNGQRTGCPRTGALAE